MVQFELSALQVAIEAMEKKTQDLAEVVRSNPPDPKKLQLLLQGSISAQVCVCSSVEIIVQRWYNCDLLW